MFKSLIFATGAFVGFFALLDYALSIPDVHFSYTTNECVEVLNYPSTLFGTTEFSCENMPSKFNHVWVK